MASIPHSAKSQFLASISVTAKSMVMASLSFIAKSVLMASLKDYAKSSTLAEKWELGAPALGIPARNTMAASRGRNRDIM